MPAEDRPIARMTRMFILESGPLRRPMDHRGLRALLIVQGFITAGAGLVLVIAPSLIPSVVGIYLPPSAYLHAYLLAGAEFGFSVLSFGGSGLTDVRALRLVVWSCIVFHTSSGVLVLLSHPAESVCRI